MASTRVTRTRSPGRTRPGAARKLTTRWYGSRPASWRSAPPAVSARRLGPSTSTSVASPDAAPVVGERELALERLERLEPVLGLLRRHALGVGRGGRAGPRRVLERVAVDEADLAHQA